MTSLAVTITRIAAITAFLAATTALGAAPAAPKKPVTDTYHGVAVTGEYRWLEDGNDQNVQKWSEAQNAHARSALDKLPRRRHAPREAHEDHGRKDDQPFRTLRPWRQGLCLAPPAAETAAFPRPSARRRSVLDTKFAKKHLTESVRWAMGK